MFCSYLNSLVPVFNKVAREHFIDNLRSRADGETVVDMLKEFGDSTLEVISMVSEYVTRAVKPLLVDTTDTACGPKFILCKPEIMTLIYFFVAPKGLRI